MGGKKTRALIKRGAARDMRAVAARWLDRQLVQASLAQLTWSELSFVQQAVAQIPWFHNCLLLDRVATPLREERGDAAKIEAATGLRRGFSRQAAAHLPVRRSGREGGKELGYGG